MQPVILKNLDHVRLFLIEVTLFSAFRKAKTEDIRAAKGVDLHPDEVLTLGSQRVFDAQRLNVFNRLKDRMHRVCMKFGTPFLSGYAIPDSRADQASAELEAIINEAMVEKANLVANYDSYLQTFCDAHPDWAPQIKAKAFTASYIDARIGFKYTAMRVSAARDDGKMVDNLTAQVGGLLGNLLQDVGEMARSLQADSLSGRDKVTRKALRPLKAARDKLVGFTFLDARVQAIADMIDTVCDAVPADGPVEGADLAMLWGITGMLMDPVRMMAVADTYQPDSAADFLATLCPQAVELAPAVTADAAAAAVPDLVPVPVSDVLATPVQDLPADDQYGGLFGGSETASPFGLQPVAALQMPQDDFSSLFGG